MFIYLTLYIFYYQMISQKLLELIADKGLDRKIVKSKMKNNY